MNGGKPGISQHQGKTKMALLLDAAVANSIL
jgi:hypothetical protein